MDGDRLAREQDPAYRATLLPIGWAQVKTALTFLHFGCTSYDTTCRRIECFYGESMGKYGQFYGQIYSCTSTVSSSEIYNDSHSSIFMSRKIAPTREIFSPKAANTP
jgi:hypothetical protein